MSRAPLAPLLLIASWCCAPIASAQDEAPPAPADELPPLPAEPDVEEPSAPEPSDPYPAEAEPAQPQRRYEGEVGSEGGGVAYDDYGDDTPDGEASAGGSGGEDFKMPGFSIRLDPFNWLLEGRLGLELEVVVWKFISVELVPIFVVDTEPPSFNFSGREDPISQHSNGLGPIAGASLGVGFWISGTPLRGYVLRALLTNYNYTYEASDAEGVFDRVNHAERVFAVMIGSYSRFGFFTIGGGLGLGYELNQGERCIVNAGTSQVTAASSGCADEDEMQIMAERDGTAIADLNGIFHPIYLLARFSLGVSFD